MTAIEALNGNTEERSDARGGQLRPFVRAAVNFSSPERKKGCLHSLPELIDFNAANNPDHVFCIQAKATRPFTTLTHSQFKAAVDRCAQWITENIHLLPTTKEDALTKMAPVALFMESDVGLLIHEFALMTLGIPALVLSARLPPAAIFHLLEATSASAFIVSRRLSEPAKPALGALTMKGISVHVGLPYGSFHNPEIGFISQRVSQSPADLDSNILLLHSSGTTGLPKPIPLTHRQLLFAVSCHNFVREEEAQGLNISAMPLFHGYGLVAPGLSMSAGKTTCFPAADGPPTALSLIELVKGTKAKSIMVVPFLLDDICAMPNDEGIKTLAKLDFVGTGGAALAAGVGDRLTQGGVKILNFYGTTETGPLSQTFAPTDGYDWRYFRLRTDINLNISELESKNGERRFRLTVFPFGGAEGIEIADQLIRNENHPKTDYAVVGRDDDVIVLATGEKVNPLILESMLSSSDMAKSAIAFGENQFEIGVIVEPTKPLSPDQYDQFKETIWPLITRAGGEMDAFARISSRDAIIIAPANTTMPRTDKGSIARKEVYQLFQAEISKVYEKLQLVVEDANIKPLDFNNLEQSVKDLIQNHLNLRVNPEEFIAEDNFFDLGMDSLQALKLRRVLLSAVTASASNSLNGQDVSQLIAQDFVYLNPSVRQIVNALRKTPGSTEQVEEIAWEEVDKFAREYCLKEEDGVEAMKAKEIGPHKDAVVLLTGSSGSLGSHCLADLARSSQVSQIICLIRKGKGGSTTSATADGQYHRSILKSKGIQLLEDQWSKISILECDPTAHLLGLSDVDYTNIQGRITHVIHAAWPMDFHRRLPSFRYQFQFLQNLLLLALQRHTVKCRFIFISSIATVAKQGLINKGRLIEESPLKCIDSACGIGYADAKLVCEKILEQAVAVYGSQMEISIVRCGQITGSRKTGVWNSIEQIPILLRSSQSIGLLPQLRGTLSWIPVDDTATVISEITLSPGPLGFVHHVENPVRQAWGDLLETIERELGLSRTIPFEEWLDQVASAKDTGTDIDAYPAKKLYTFFKLFFRPVACGEVILSTDIARTRSSTLRNMGAVDTATVHGYLNHWRETGYLK